MAAFRNLEERFSAKMNGIYGQYSTKDLPDLNRGTQPYLETKPNDNKPNFGGPRTSEFDAIAADVSRLTKFSTNKPGWYLDQQNLQSGNTFGETRVINPLFLIGSAQPFAHIKRTLADAKNTDLGGDGPHPGSPNNVGAAGRLQKETSKKIVNLLTTGGQRTVWDRLASIAPPNRLFNTISMVSNVIGDTGPVDINQRPEMDMGATGRFDRMFSIEAWKTEGYGGFVRTDTPTSTLARVGSNLRSGNIRGALNALNSAGRNVVNDARTAVQDVGRVSNRVISGARNIFGGGNRNQQSTTVPDADMAAEEERGSTTSAFAGKRYFITSIKPEDDLKADRYMMDSVMTVIEHTAAGDYNWTDTQLRIGSKPHIFREAIVTLNDQMILDTPSRGALSASGTGTSQVPVNQAAQSSNNRTQNIVNQNTRAARNAQRRAQIALTRGPAAARRIIDSERSQALGRSIQGRLAQSAANSSATGGTTPPNPAEDKMKFPGLSLRQTYNSDDRLEEIRTSINTQQETWLATISRIGAGFRGAGFKGGISVNGTPVQITPGAKNPFTVESNVNGFSRYFYDDLNTYPVVPSAKTENNLTKEAMDAIKGEIGVNPLVDLYFFDFVNKTAIPFRANILSFSETVNPEFTDIFYIGRTERNIVYTGVRREMNLSWIIHAYNEAELSGIWAKLNYLTSLCFPSQYSRGFMVPPLLKITLGDVYNNQPGYIRSLSYTVDPDTTWETTEPFQVPHGVTVNMSYSIIEKIPQASIRYIGYDPLSPRDGFAPLYAYGNPRARDRHPPPPPPPNRTRNSCGGTATPPRTRPNSPRGGGPVLPLRLPGVPQDQLRTQNYSPTNTRPPNQLRTIPASAPNSAASILGG